MVATLTDPHPTAHDTAMSCPACRGRGCKICRALSAAIAASRRDFLDLDAPVIVLIDCDFCGGTGLPRGANPMGDGRCRICHGYGTVSEHAIFAGVR